MQPDFRPIQMHQISTSTQNSVWSYSWQLIIWTHRAVLWKLFNHIEQNHRIAAWAYYQLDQRSLAWYMLRVLQMQQNHKYTLKRLKICSDSLTSPWRVVSHLFGSSETEKCSIRCLYVLSASDRRFVWIQIGKTSSSIGEPDMYWS